MVQAKIREVRVEGTFLEQQTGDEAGWQRIQFGVFLDSLLYAFVLPPRS